LRQNVWDKGLLFEGAFSADDFFLSKLPGKLDGVFRGQAAKSDLVSAACHDGLFHGLGTDLSAFHLQLTKGLDGKDAGHPVFGGDGKEKLNVRVDVAAVFVDEQKVRDSRPLTPGPSEGPG